MNLLFTVGLTVMFGFVMCSPPIASPAFIYAVGAIWGVNAGLELARFIERCAGGK